MAVGADADQPWAVGLTVGLGGVVVAERWNAARVTVHNPGAAVDATLELDLVREDWRAKQVTSSYTIPLHLPPGDSRHETAVFLAARASRGVHAHIIDYLWPDCG